jgi:hypothetical protein
VGKCSDVEIRKRSKSGESFRFEVVVSYKYSDSGTLMSVLKRASKKYPKAALSITRVGG